MCGTSFEKNYKVRNRFFSNFHSQFLTQSCITFYYSSLELKLYGKNICFTWEKAGRKVEKAKQSRGLTKYKLIIPIFVVFNKCCIFLDR